MDIDGNFGKLVQKKILRVGLLQLLCLEKLYAQKAEYEDTEVNTLNVKKPVGIELGKSLLDKKWL